MEYYDLEESRLRFFGGTARIWGGRCAVLNQIDFQKRDWVPHSGWPISDADLAPYYRRAHAQLDLAEFNYDRDVWSLLEVPDPKFDPGKIKPALWRFDESGDRFSPSQCQDLFDSQNVSVLLHANVVHLQANDDASQVQSLTIRSLDGKERRVHARYYVLAAGAIENARLLLASTDVESAGIGNRHDQVGRYFMEHPIGRIARVKVEHPFQMWAAMRKRFMPAGPPLAPLLRLAENTQRERQALNSVVTFKLQRDPEKGMPLMGRIYPTLKHTLRPNATGLALNQAYRSVRAWIHREVRDMVEHARTRLGTRDLYLIMRGEQSPNPESRVVLSDSRDGLGMPRVNLNWNLSAADKQTGKIFVDTFDSELKRLGLGSLEPCEWLYNKDVHWPLDPTVGNHPIGGYHHMGTTRMNDSPSQGVVTADCRVHGYENLYVAGSSVFSTSGWANPTLTVSALSLRLADHLTNRLES